MYEEYGRLTKKPFENTPAPEFFYHSSQHEEALAKSLGSHGLPTKKTEVLTNLILENLNNALINNVRDGKD